MTHQIKAKVVAEKISSYLHHEIELSELVEWAENTMLEGDFDDKNHEELRDIVSRLGVADVKAFGLTWEDCENFLNQLGYGVKIEVIANDIRTYD